MGRDIAMSCVWAMYVDCRSQVDADMEVMMLLASASHLVFQLVVCILIFFAFVSLERKNTLFLWTK